MLQRSSSDLVLKIVLAGEGGVGKTALRTRYLEGIFRNNYVETLGADLALKDVELKDLKLTVTCQVWDIAGQPAFHEVRKAYFAGCTGALVVYDVTNPDTLRATPQWIKEIQQGSYLSKRVPIILTGNKIDLRSKNHPHHVSTDKGKQHAESLGIDFIETSAKTGEMVDQAFEQLVRKALTLISTLED